MKISYKWLQDYFESKLPSPALIAEKITFHAFEIESLEEVGGHFNNVVIGKVLKKEKHPNADRLHICTVDVGDGGREIVCGAVNVAEGQTVAVALPGAVLPGNFEIKVSKIRGVESNGMICSEKELGFTKEAEGIWVIEKEVKVGTPLKEFLHIETDSIFDIKVLPDRAHDCLSHEGIAREVGAILDIPLNKKVQAKELQKSSTLQISIENPKLVPRYSAVILRNVKVGQSPKWLKERLLSIGQKPINNVVDITNFVMQDMGQPLHAFDLSHIFEKEGVRHVHVRGATEGEQFIGLDDVEYKLPSSALLITDKQTNVVLGIGGIKGGKASSITEKTTDILLESANFDPVQTRLTSQALKLRTESSVRFEKELSPELVHEGLMRAVSLLEELAGAKDEGLSDTYPSPHIKKEISLRQEDIKRVLGIHISLTSAQKILTALECEVCIEKDVLKVIPPYRRLDLNLKENIIEEVGRIHGYDNVAPVALPESNVSPKVNKLFYYILRITDLLSKQGFSEIKTYSFRNEGKVEIANPIALDKKYVRENLTRGVLESHKLNEYNAPLLGLNQIKVFEIGTVFTKDGEEHVSLCLSVKNAKGWRKEGEVDTLQDVLNILRKELGVDLMTKDSTIECNLEEIIEKLRDASEYGMELNQKKKTYTNISVYPFILRDIALWVPKEVTDKEIEKLIRIHAGKLLVKISLFDVFEKDGKTSYAFRLVFQSQDKTLSDEEINKVMEQIVGEVEKKGWTVR